MPDGLLTVPASPPTVRPHRRTDHPFDLPAIHADPSWRQDLAWPRAYPDTARLAESVQAAVVGAIGRLPVGESRDIAVMMGGYAAASVLPLAECAHLVVAERRSGLRLHGQVPELTYLRGETEDRPERRGRRDLRAHAVPNHRVLRRLARTASWTPWHRLPLALLRPDAMAISHNPLLHQAARRAGTLIGFTHCEALVRAVRRTPPAANASGAAHDAADCIATAILEATTLDPDVRERLAALVAEQCHALAEEAAYDLASLRNARLPAHVWAGTGGHWPVRAVSLEVLRRGGKVTRFDHGGGTGLNRFRNSWALTDIAVSSTFHVATDGLAARVVATGAADLLPPATGTVVLGGHGDPHVAAVPLRRIARAASRRSVLYGPGPLRGFRQVVPAMLPDPVALDWQLRLVAQLKSLPVDLICRPHPEGLLRNRRHPVADLVEPAAEPFETLVARTDVFVFDYVQSTTFYVALCTDRPIVLLDMGTNPFADDVAAAIAERCRIVAVDFGADNLPRVDPATLETAVCDGPATVDPGFFRALILGPTADADQ